jgi:hypothetical protein
LEGFIRSRFVGCLHIFLVTIPSHFLCYGAVGFDFEPPCVTAYRFTWVWAHSCYWCLRSGLWWLLCQGARFKVDCFFMALFSINIIWVDWETTRVTPRVFSMLLQANKNPLLLCSYSLLPDELSPYLQIYWWYNVCVDRIVSKVSHLLLVVESNILVLVPQSEPLIIQYPMLIYGASYILSGILLLVMS